MERDCYGLVNRHIRQLAFCLMLSDVWLGVDRAKFIASRIDLHNCQF